MAVQSMMTPLGTPAPDFDLLDTVSGRRMSLADFSDAKALVVMFICNHCPYVIHIREGLVEFGRDYADREAAVVAVSSNDADNYPDDAPHRLAEAAREVGYAFPVLYDETQETALAYKAACTPDFYVFDADRQLVYRGRFDEARPNSAAPVTGADLRAAVEAVLADRPVPSEQMHSIGCSIKWRPGVDPGY